MSFQLLNLMLQINSEKPLVSYRLNRKENFEFQNANKKTECNSPLEGVSAAFNAIFSEQEVDLLPANSEEVPPPCSAVPRRDSQIYQPITAGLT